MNKKRILFFAPTLLFSFTILGACTSSSDTAVVKFNTDGGTLIADVTVKKGEKVTRPGTDPYKNGFTFINWFDVPYGTKEANIFNFDKGITGDTTIYAHYTAISVDFDIEPSIVTIKKGEERELKVVFKYDKCLVDTITWTIDTTKLEKISESSDHKTFVIKGKEVTGDITPTDVKVVVKSKAISQEITRTCNVYVTE